MTVAQRYWQFQLTVPADTPIASPLVVDIDLGDVRLDRVDIRFPPGPSGLVGVQLVNNGTVIIPWGNDTQWLYGDDEPFSVPVGDEVDQGLVLQAYNLDTFDHTIPVRLLNTPMTLIVASMASVAPVPSMVGQTGTVAPAQTVSVGGVDTGTTAQPSAPPAAVQGVAAEPTSSTSTMGG